ncbi:MAG TPA: tyrosine-type recombinase/integrase [Steroidobacteraceae bacterium]|nr:tyrosine-type recombinase/integrase [Steroidobacteraceae bacterium]
MRLTDKAIKAAISKQRRAKLFDGGGLYLLLRPVAPLTRPHTTSGEAGSRSSLRAFWRQKYYWAGVEKLISHGPYPRVSLRLARKRRDEAKEQLEAGIDPSAQRKAAKAARRSAAKSTFEALAREWYAKQAKTWAASNADKVIGRLENDAFPRLGGKPVRSLTSDEILQCLRLVEERGAHESAHRIRQYIDAIYKYAVHTGQAHANPTPAPGALAPAKKAHFASITEPKGVGALIRAIRSYEGTEQVRIALQLAALTFVRPGELRAAEWREFDPDAGEWRIRPERMKVKGAAHIVPLSKQALALLEQLKPLTGSGKYLFPSERSPLRPMSENTLTAALRALGYSKEQMTVHGFRHMASTLLNEHGWKADAIERQLAHMPRDQVRAAYNTAQYLPERRELMAWWANRLDALAAADGKVVSIGRHLA